ncbi:MAG: diguanylate cyclase [Pseudanabaenaceae cyanobacterium SKYGB_i_bin29]|nr:diguanylate cyclase [Pseudanabaenaceae cyanobacterium SKYG29]MDW8420577.1 diguanylate cyclase [Pseudanabaenaceae cyanobacterium SKYGB_i_bin29]
MSDQVEELKQRIKELEEQKADLEAALQVAVEHGDAVEAQLIEANKQLRDEIQRRHQMELYLKKVARDREKEKQDLMIILETLVAHGDAIDDQWRQEMAMVTLLAETDALTMIGNRRRFDTYLYQQWELMQVKISPLSLILCDVDFFKPYNDHYGHPQGDECLKKIAHALSSVVRSGSDMVCRYGGEEFGIILPNTDAYQAVMIAERILRVIQELAIPHAYSPVANIVTLSLGIATIVPHSQVVLPHLIQVADTMLYRAKELGRNRYAVQDLTDRCKIR